jgi:hypothetical protein
MTHMASNAIWLKINKNIFGLILQAILEVGMISGCKNGENWGIGS